MTEWHNSKWQLKTSALKLFCFFVSSTHSEELDEEDDDDIDEDIDEASSDGEDDVDVIEDDIDDVMETPLRSFVSAGKFSGPRVKPLQCDRFLFKQELKFRKQNYDLNMFER